MSDIGKAWVDGVREPSYTEIESRIHHQKYSELMSNEFDERVDILPPPNLAVMVGESLRPITAPN